MDGKKKFLFETLSVEAKIAPNYCFDYSFRELKKPYKLEILQSVKQNTNYTVR